MDREPRTTNVPVNMYRTEDRLMVAALMPGLQPDDISIDVGADGQLQLRGELRGRLKDWKDVLQEEWQAGGSQRTLDLPVAVDGAAGRATYENGVLVVVLPVAAAPVAGRFAPSPGQGH
jgi:HSP20 family protein